MLPILSCLVFLSGLFPLLLAWQANRRTTLGHAVLWAAAAWMAWAWIVVEEALRGGSAEEWCYLALGLTGCAGVAVLGARRPGVGAWNFVVAGLLGVMMFLHVEYRFAGEDVLLARVRMLLAAAALAVGIVNYLPTRLAPAAILLAIGAGINILAMAGQLDEAVRFSRLVLAIVPWTAFARIRWAETAASEFDQSWLDFRNRFGLVWAQRLREQFNHAALNAGWPVILRWQGLRLEPGAEPPGLATQKEVLTVLRALMKRFGLDETSDL